MSQNFYQRMRRACLAIPEGRVATYGQIALLCGAPRHARQVGYGLNKDLAGSDVPAYRVVNSRGELSGACHFLIPDWQKLMLEQEGVEVQWNGKLWHADLERFGWEPSSTEIRTIQEAWCDATSEQPGTCSTR